MKSFIISVSFLLSILPGLIFSQSLQEFRGVILDSDSGEPIAHASLSWEGEEKIYSSDALGKFYLRQSPTATLRLKVDALGYKSKVVSLDKDRQEITIILDLVSFDLAEQDILVAEEVLRKAFSNTEYLLDKPYNLEMMARGSWQGMDNPESYRIEALLEFHLFKKHDAWLGMIREARNLSEAEGKKLDYGFWSMIGLGFQYRQGSPCKVQKQGCWEKNMKVEYVKTQIYNERKVYVISLDIDPQSSKKLKLEGSPFGLGKYKSDYIIDAENFQILRQVSQTTPQRIWKQSINSEIYVEAKGFTVIRNYKQRKGKYYLASCKSVVEFELNSLDNSFEPRSTYLEHELLTLKILSGAAYKKPNLSEKEGYYPLGNLGGVPFHKAFWDQIDQFQE